MSPHEHTPRSSRPPEYSRRHDSQRPQPSVAQLEAKVAHELSNLLNVVAACKDRLASSPEVTAAARLDLLALAGRVAHAILDARRRGISLRRRIAVNPTLRNLEVAGRLLLPPAVEVALDLDPSAGSVLVAPGELDLLILNLVLDARARLGESGRLAIRSAREPGDDGEAVAIAVEDLPRGTSLARSTLDAQFGLATVRMIARDAGAIDVRPGRSGGCEIRIRLQARPSDAS